MARYEETAGDRTWKTNALESSRFGLVEGGGLDGRVVPRAFVRDRVKSVPYVPSWVEVGYIIRSGDVLE